MFVMITLLHYHRTVLVSSGGPKMSDEEDFERYQKERARQEEENKRIQAILKVCDSFGAGMKIQRVL